MTKRKKVILTLIAYVTTILIFSIIYWILWVNNPSNFIVNEQYNEQTLEPFFPFDSLPDRNRIIDKMVSTSESNSKIKPYYDSIYTLNSQLLFIDSQLYESKILDSLNSMKVIKSYNKNLDSFLYKKLKPFAKIKDSIESEIIKIKSLQSKTAANSSEYLQNEVLIARLKVRLSTNEFDINQGKYDIYDKALKSMTNFYDDTLKLIADLLYKRIDTLEKRKNKILQSIGDKKEYIRLLAVEFWHNRVFRLGFQDFLYFSVISATSTGYGDILPNTTRIRNLVSLEIMISIFLFAFFFYFLSQPSKVKPNSSQ